MGYKLTRITFILYQSIFASKNATCRYRPTCSRYALDAVSRYGLPKGSLMAIKRVLSCHPFSNKPMYDPA